MTDDNFRDYQEHSCHDSLIFPHGLAKVKKHVFNFITFKKYYIKTVVQYQIIKIRVIISIIIRRNANVYAVYKYTHPYIYNPH